jgi:hypothetical protein
LRLATLDAADYLLATTDLGTPARRLGLLVELVHTLQCVVTRWASPILNASTRVKKSDAWAFFALLSEHGRLRATIKASHQ